MKKQIAALRKRHRSIDRFFSDDVYSALVMLRFSAAVNILFALIRLCAGIVFRSFWLVTLAAYYGLLIAMKLLLLRRSRGDAIGNSLVWEYRKYRACAVVLLFMNVALAGMVVLIIRVNEGFRYGGVTIYAMAAYDFYTLISAVINLVKARRHERPLLSASRVVSFASALIAMLALETAMFARFGAGDGTGLRNRMVAITGGAAAAIILSTAVYMLLRSRKELKKLEKENDP